MKKLKRELRMLIAEWLLGKAISICPKDEAGLELVAYVGGYFASKINSK